MSIKIHVMHTGEVIVSPDLPFGGDDCSMLKASGIFLAADKRLHLPVSTYLIEHPEHGLILFDAGWDRSMSPEGVFDKKSQVKSLGSHLLYKVNQGVLPLGEAVDEQLAAMGVKTSELDLVALSHLDCDHANGLRQVADAKRIIVSADEVAFAGKHPERYSKSWWEGVPMEQFEWNGFESAPNDARKHYDIFGDGTLVLVNIPGHADGQAALRVSAPDGRFVLLFADGGYATKSWAEMITSGICADKVAQKASLAWIAEQSRDERCVESLANHDPDVAPHLIEL